MLQNRNDRGSVNGLPKPKQNGKIVRKNCRNFLRNGSRCWVNIIDDEHVHLHIECKEVCKLVPYIDSIHILGLESVCRNIENYQLRIPLLDLDTDSLRKMSLSKTRTSEKEKRVERSLSRSHRNAFTSGESHLVTFSDNEIFETIYRIQLRIDLYTLHSGEHERTGITSSAEGLDRYSLVHRNIAMSCRINQRLLLADRSHDVSKVIVYRDDMNPLFT